MKYILVKFNEYCNEFDIDGFVITTKEDWDSFISELSHHGFFEYYFSTNYGVEYHSIEDFIKQCEIIPLEETGADYLREKFGKIFGSFPSCIQILELYDDGREEEIKIDLFDRR